jgi:hypothetical protein
LSDNTYLHFYNLNKQIKELEQQLRTARKNNDPSWLKLKRKLMKLNREKRIVSYKIKGKKMDVKPTKLLKSQDKGYTNRLLTKVSTTFFNLIGWLGSIGDVGFPLKSLRSMYLTERRLSLKKWKDKHN